jgi:hypothetical protein
MQTEKQSASRNGGIRPGAGRPKGIPNKASQVRQARVEATGVTPLEVMLHNMRTAHAEGLALDRKLARTKDGATRDRLMALRKSARDETFRCAVKAADFCHPRLQSVTHTQDPKNEQRIVHSVDNDTIKRAAIFIHTGVMPPDTRSLA